MATNIKNGQEMTISSGSDEGLTMTDVDQGLGNSIEFVVYITSGSAQLGRGVCGATQHVFTAAQTPVIMTMPNGELHIKPSGGAATFYVTA